MRLRVVSGPDTGRALALDPDAAEVCVGAARGNDLLLADPAVAPRHFALRPGAHGGYVLRGLGEAAVRLGRVRVGEVELPAGARFEAGSDVFVLEPLEVEDEAGVKPLRFGEMIGSAPPMRELFGQMERVAPSELTVLIGGETGTGKERLARSIHKLSPRADSPFVVFDCSTLSRELAESTIFGHARGAFTGAISAHTGLFEQANGGTLFLDEIGELPLDLQPKLLRVIEHREVKPLASEHTLRVDVRLIAATNRDLSEMVAEGRFREDLYFRLSVIQCRLPALRERAQDLTLLSEALIDQLCEGWVRRPRLSLGALRALRAHSWPGNVRELKNVLERAVNLSDSPVLRAADLGLDPSASSAFAPSPRARSAATAAATTAALDPDPDRARVEVGLDQPFKDCKQDALDQLERAYLERLMARAGGNITQAAREAGLSRYYVRQLLKRHDLHNPGG